MNVDWTTSPSGQRVMAHAEDARPAWLWSQDGQSLLWHNQAAELFLAKVKKHGLKKQPLAAPIKGQVQRIIRLGSVGRASLARIQFLAGERPASATCTVTPLAWGDSQTALLIVGVDPIDEAVLTAARAGAADAEQDQSQSIPEAVVDPEPAIHPETAPPPQAPSEAEPPPQGPVEPEHLSEADADAWVESVEPPPVAAPTVQDTEEAAEPAEEADWDRDIALAEYGTEDRSAETEPDGTESAGEAEAQPAPEEARSVRNRLSRLIEMLSDEPAEPAEAERTEASEAPAAEEPTPDETEAAALAVTEGEGTTQLFRVTARRIVPADESETAPEPVAETPAEPETAPPPAAETPPDPETVERVSRYNFDELARILNDRVGDTNPAPVASPAKAGELVSLGGETLVLNRLPLGILVFRDQQILFANRAITEMVGYESVESLRQAGLAAVFPAAGPDEPAAGPVNHLVQRDGTLVPVTARLQSISWHGRPALMLSASATEVRTGHEAAVRAFAEAFAEISGDGFIEATRSGMVSALSGRAREVLGESVATGKTLIEFIADSDRETLRAFLERPARFAETARPAETLRLRNGRGDLALFAQGQAGVVSGYFGLVRPRATPSAAARLAAAGSGDDPGLLARISRGVRRPLNTIIGFSDLLRTAATGALDPDRQNSYAADIASAGLEIAALVDELEDYARLREGRYLPQRASIDLAGLLESSVVRVRQQASSARVFVRSGISERLPRITADRASLAQAVLNLLASAIDQTPTGGTVVISAQHEDNGGIAIHIRDGSDTPVDMAERFVVFRDGVGRDGQALAPVRSSVGLALTRSLLAVNTFSLAVDPAGEQGLLFSLRIPAGCVEPAEKSGVAEEH
ncbi:histidine kinase dimerization/phospho-acceptor domain-containing protein [Devosia albogilva]|uniref:histidine kinase n=1 Tax=Devosia albogilva TaxID=429726 RepID=A0ABW5QLF2_9HYPH